jgi:hypothetical protein
MLTALAQVEAYLDGHWPMLWPEAHALGQSLSVDWRARPMDKVFAVLRKTKRCPADWICDLGEALANQSLPALARRTGITQRHLERLRKGSVTSAGVTRPTNPTCFTYCKVMCALGRGVPLLRLDGENFELTGPAENRKPNFPDEVRSLKTLRQVKRRGRSRHPFLRNDPMSWHKPRETDDDPQVAPQTTEVVPQVAPQTTEVVPQVAPQTTEVAPPKGQVAHPRRQVARPKRRRKTAPRTASRGAVTESRMHAPRNHARSNDCPKGHKADEANRDIETRKKIEKAALISEILGGYASASDLCGEEGGGGMTRPKDEIASMEAMIAGEAAPPTTDALALVLQKMAEMQAQTAREQREFMERADERQERSEQKQRELTEKLAAQQLEAIKQGGALTVDLVGKMSQDFNAAVQRMQANAPALSRADRVLDEVLTVVHTALRVYVEKNFKD